MKAKHILLLIMLHASGCNGSESKFELKLHHLDISDLPTRDLGAGIEDLKQNRVFKDLSNSKAEGYLSLVDEKEHIAEFKKISIDRKDVLKMLADRKEFKDYNKVFGFPFGRKPSYLGKLLYASWNVAVKSDAGDGIELIIITAFFERSQKEGESPSFQLKGFVFLDSAVKDEIINSK